ncbi:hypothetical protein BDB01DRAFT_846245 [Pilobolus umbonatus]|nr:hypothetical protein BDB01DRAFT_846245 [Pilobolus umbonatus]
MSTLNLLSSVTWLLSSDKPRISKYPYETPPRDWGLIGLLPLSLQHSLSRYLGQRILRLNMGDEYFPEQFLVGASLASRRAVELLSSQLKSPDDKALTEELHQMMGPDLLDRFMSSVNKDMNIDIDIPQIYDANVGDIWITLGNANAFSNEKQYDILRWMTVQVGIHKATKNEEDESFPEYRERIAKSILEGVQVGVDVLIDADVKYEVTSKSDNDVLLYDEGRRNIRMRFATPYFQPANKMVTGRDPETGEPINDWNWRLVDIDQLLESESMHEE